MVQRSGQILALVAALAGFAACDVEQQAPAAPAPAPAASAPPPAAAAASPAPAVPAGSRWIGVVLAAGSVDVAAEGSGRLQRVVVAVGDRVGRGQLLAVVDTSLLQPDLRRAEATLREARADLARLRALAEQAQLRYQRRKGTPEIFSKEDLENAELEARSTRTAEEAGEARVQQEQAGVERLRQSLAQAEIRAPFDGAIAFLHLTPGATVAPGSPVLRLATTEELLARFAVPPGEAGGLAVGETVEVTAAGGRPPQVVPAVVSRIAPEVDVPSQRVFVEARLPASGPALQAGLEVEVRPGAGGAGR
jgi:RND family efflux transporter MFP subunit